MTYHERELPVLRSSQKRTFHNSNHRSYSSRFSFSPSLRIQCQANERHFLNYSNSSSHINSSFKFIRFTMNEHVEPIRFRSEIVLHNHPDTDLHIKRLRVNFHYPDDRSVNTIVDHNTSTSSDDTRRQQKQHLSQSSLVNEQKKINSKKKFRSGLIQSQNILHLWIDKLSNHEELMNNDNIVFFIKNGEFFARI